MLEGQNFFDQMDHLEPHCPKCKAKIDYGTTTEFDESCNCHVCLGCGEKLK
ncbi:MAG: hypothetical protein KJ709_05250 [Nanoarchaeota archaeon]|nr:hypothetical protein [Nanoarchaeota archaeon]